MSEKTVLLEEAEVELDRFKRAIAGLSEAEMRETWSGTWAVRDIVAHLSGWHREIGPALERLARGEKPIPEGVNYMDADPWNARFAAAKANASAFGLVAAPCMYRRLLNRFAVPHSSLIPLRCCSSLSTFTTASRLRFVSASDAPSGATSRSWNA